MCVLPNIHFRIRKFNSSHEYQYKNNRQYLVFNQRIIAIRIPKKRQRKISSFGDVCCSRHRKKSNLIYDQRRISIRE